MITTKLTKQIAAISAVSLIAVACGGSGDTAASPTGSTTGTPTTDATDASDAPTTGDSTLAGVEAAQWSDNVAITVNDDGTFNFASDGLPSHELPDEFLVPTSGQFEPPVTEDETNVVATAVAVVASPVDVDIPLVPVWSETTTDTNLGIIGVMISGAQLFNDYEDMDRQFVAVDDNFSVDGVGFVDACNGHPLALLADGTGNGNYHYHGVPYCITDVVDVAGEHSTIIGVLLDGYPVYGNKDVDGAEVTNADLDECSGHVGVTPEFPEGIYHYHLTDDAAPYTIDCYHGEVAASSADAGGPGGGGPPGGAPDGGPPPSGMAPVATTSEDEA